MFCDRICLLHNFPCIAVNLKACQEDSGGFLCAKCLTDQNESDEVAHLFDVQSTIDEIVEQQKNKEKQFINHLTIQLEELRDSLNQFQQQINNIINKQLTTLLEKLNHLEKNDAFYLQFIKKYYKGKYVLSCPHKLDRENTNLMQFIKEGIETLIKSDNKKKIYEQLKCMVNESNQEEIITKKVTQKINQKQVITLTQDCPIHQQKITLITLDQKCQRNRLICIECLEECQYQGLKQIYSIQKVNQMWKDHNEKLSQSLNQISDQSQKNIDQAQQILQNQNIKLNDSIESLQQQIGQCFSEIKNKQKKIDQEIQINFQELENEELLQRINYLAEGQKETEFQNIQGLLKKEEKEFVNGVKQHSLALQQFKNDYEQLISSELKIEDKKSINKNMSFFNDKYNCGEYLRKIHQQCQSIANLTLEDCNNFVVDNDESIIQIIRNWSKDLQNVKNFKQFALILVDQIKRQKLSQFTSQLRNINGNLQLNPKQLFYLMYINSSEELQFKLLRNQIYKQSVPFLYFNPNMIKTELFEDLFLLNKNLYYLFPECYPIINLSLSKVHSSFGKTQLINKIFYKQEVFEVNDYCDLNLHTIDIMFDFCFSGTRNLAITDVHGIIPFEILIKILPFFKLWIIQIDTEDELQENFEQFTNIKEQLQNLNSECCFIIRNSKTKEENELNQLEIEVKDQGISLYKIIDLTQKGLDKQKINSEIEQFSQFIFGIINNKKSNQSNSQDFLRILQNYYGQNNQEIKQINQDNQLLELLLKELKIFTNDPKGFQSQNAFLMRSLIQQVQSLKQSVNQFDGQIQDQLNLQVESKEEEIKTLEQKIQFTKPTQLIELFQQIFYSKNHHNLYYKFIEQIKLLNEKNQVDQQNIEIELFWRELKYIKQHGQNSSLKINPAEIMANLVQKGEPFEILDGDQLEIEDIRFLVDFLKQFSKHNEKVLIVSILGSQSSGKSTILNNMFGCHFTTSGRKSTKGIQLSLLKIQQKSYFDNKFDYILVLDSEGIQYTSQKDPAFDKKVALFILAISDIILINFKGDFDTNVELKKIIEMCVFALGSFKKFYLCFNQNNDRKNFAPFLQIKRFVNELNLQVNKKTEVEGDNSSFDFNEVLDLKKENVYFFGFSSTEYSWNQNVNTGIFEKQRQQILNETFSEEANIIGVQIIRQYLKKIDNNFKFSSFIQIIQNIESIWQSICKLPDILEFTVILEQKQVELMEARYEQIYQKQSFNLEIQIQSQIQNSVLREHNKNQEFFQKLEDYQKQFITQEVEETSNKVEQDLQQYQNKYQIFQRIFRSQIIKLNQQLKNYELHCLEVLIDEIYKYKREYLQKEKFQQRELIVAQISQNAQEFKKLKGDRQQQKKQFDEIWSNIIKEAKQQQEKVFTDFADSQYVIIQSQFPQYQYNSTNQGQFYNFFFNMSKNSPKNNSNDELSEILKEFKKEIHLKEQFQIVLNQNIKYNDIFYQPILVRLNKSKNTNIVDLNDFFQYQAVIYSIQSDKFSQYLKGDAFYKDFCEYMKQQKQNQANQETNKERFINKLFSSFFSILDILQISFNQKIHQDFKDFTLKRNTFAGLFDFRDSRKIFFDFQQSLNFSQNTYQLVKRIEFTRNMRITYPSLCLQEIELQSNSLEELEQQLSQQNGQIKFFCYQIILPRNNTHKLFEFIQDQQQNSNLSDQFNQYSLTLFQQIISDKERWNKIYFEIYEIIKQKMIQVKSQFKQETQSIDQQQNDLEKEEIYISDNYLIKYIISIIEQKILEYNKQFAKFGVIFSTKGERCIYYYSILIIWRFSCYSKWNQLEENHQELVQMREEQLKRFIAEIEQNYIKQSRLNAQVLLKNLKFGFLERFFEDQQSNAKQLIKSINMSSSNVVQILDQRLLLNYGKAKQNNIRGEEILDYILDQKSYIEKYAEKQIKIMENQIKQEYQEKLRIDLGEFLQEIQKNISLIESFTLKESCALKSEEYFQENDDDIRNCDHESQLFYLVFRCILGKKIINENLLKIKNQYKQLFIQNYEQINIPIFIKTQHESEKKIQLLKPFIEELSKLVKQQIQNSHKEPLFLKNLKIQENLNQVQFNMIGCLHQCPICNRKCDNPKDSNHQHFCQNGHHYRGNSNFFRFGKFCANFMRQFQSCGEIDENALITTRDTLFTRKWREIKNAYSDWNFIETQVEQI